MKATFVVPVGMPETVTITLAPKELLALTAVLDAADDALLADNGVSEEVIEVADELYNQMETVTSMIYGDDWDLRTSVEAAGEQYDDGLSEEDMQFLDGMMCDIDRLCDRF
jgi:hypothetical protein